MAKAACELVSGAITLPSSIISMEQARLDTYHEILDEQGISNPNLFEYFFYNDIADWKFLGNTAASSVKGICNEFDEKIINGTTEERAEVGGEIFFNAICAVFAYKYLSNKKTSVDDVVDDIKPLEKTKPIIIGDEMTKIFSHLLKVYYRIKSLSLQTGILFLPSFILFYLKKDMFYLKNMSE